MVNLAHCTKNVFDPHFIHIIHIDIPPFPPYSSPIASLMFTGKSTYTPTYPHYPHFSPTFYLYPQNIFLAGIFVNLS